MYAKRHVRQAINYARFNGVFSESLNPVLLNGRCFIRVRGATESKATKKTINVINRRRKDMVAGKISLPPASFRFDVD